MAPAAEYVTKNSASPFAGIVTVVVGVLPELMVTPVPCAIVATAFVLLFYAFSFLNVFILIKLCVYK